MTCGGRAGYPCTMDEQLTLREVRRLEAERKLQSIPEAVLETAWVREAQVEAVIDAVLSVTVGGEARAYAHARHVGQWCARMAAGLPSGPDPVLARRVGVLADVDPAVLDRVDEVAHLAPYVRDYQAAALDPPETASVMSIMVMVAAEFEQRLATCRYGTYATPLAVLRTMMASGTSVSAPVLDALSRTLKSNLPPAGTCDVAAARF